MAELMKGIQAGKGRLKKVSEDEIEREKKDKKEASTGMFGGAVKAIMARRAAINVDDSASDDDDDEWS